jgi:uncharacterized protein
MGAWPTPRGVIYADTSALIRAYMSDEGEQGVLSRRLLEGDQAVATSEIFVVEAAAALARAVRAERSDAAAALARVHADCDPARGGSIALLVLTGGEIVAVAEQLALRHGLRALDSLHLATCLRWARGADEDVVFITRAHDQAAAARAEGLTVE